MRCVNLAVNGGHAGQTDIVFLVTVTGRPQYCKNIRGLCVKLQRRRQMWGEKGEGTSEFIARISPMDDYLCTTEENEPDPSLLMSCLQERNQWSPCRHV